MVDDVEIHDAETSDSRGREIHPERRAEAAGADHQHARLLELRLPFHGDFRHDEMPAVALDLLVCEAHLVLDRRRASSDGWHDAHNVRALNRRFELRQRPDVVVVHVDVHKAPKLARIVKEVLAKLPIARREIIE